MLDNIHKDEDTKTTGGGVGGGGLVNDFAVGPKGVCLRLGLHSCF